MNPRSERLTLPVLVFLVATCVGLMARWLVRWHPWVAATVAILTAAVVLSGPSAAALLAAAAFAVLAMWSWRWPDVFDAQITRRVRTGWRFELIYRWRWTDAMYLFGLAGQVPDTPGLPGRPAKMAQHRPQMVRLVCGTASDRLLVKHRLGHEQTHWDIRTGALAQSFGALACKVTPADPGYLWLTFRRRETLTATVRPAVPRPAHRVDLDALRVGITEDGDPWRLRLASTPSPDRRRDRLREVVAVVGDPR